MIQLKVIYTSNVSLSLIRFGALAKALGISAEYLPVSDCHSFLNLVQKLHGDAHLVVDVDSMSGVCKEVELNSIATVLRQRRANVLLLTTTASAGANRFVEIMTHKVVCGIYPVDTSSVVGFPNTSSKANGELASYSYRRKQGRALILNVCVETAVEILMTLDDQPAFVSLAMGGGTAFVWSTAAVFDVERPLAAEIEFEEAADEYIPAMMFLRVSFGDGCWHNPCNGAGIVIDDPLLRKSYGYLNFPQLLESSREHGYHITLAFIPWNYRRVNGDVELFRRYSDSFNVCAHGCDHTNREFRSTDYEMLLQKNFTAQFRMEQLSQRTGITADQLMVCPQEQYSLEAMRAFADSRQFFGLVCTACMPRNLRSPQLSGADLLLPAQDSFFGFPVFKRHYWRDMSVFAMALFLGKPAILVEHHEFFKNGPSGVNTFVSGLAKLRPDIKWSSLTEMATRSHLRRRVADDSYELRFFTDKFKFEHESAMSTQYRFMRRVPSGIVVREVTLNGNTIPFVQENGFLTFDSRIDWPQEVTIELGIPPTRPIHPKRFGLGYKAGVALRRGLSEFRDNVLAKNPLALRFSRAMARVLRQTVDSP